MRVKVVTQRDTYVSAEIPEEKEEEYWILIVKALCGVHSFLSLPDTNGTTCFPRKVLEESIISTIHPQTGSNA